MNAHNTHPDLAAAGYQVGADGELSRPLPMPVLGMAGWGVADPDGGDYLSDGAPTAAIALETAEDARELIGRGVAGETAREAAAQIAYAKHRDAFE